MNISETRAFPVQQEKAAMTPLPVPGENHAEPKALIEKKVAAVASERVVSSIQIPSARGIADELFAKHMYLERRCGGGTQSYSPFSSFSQVPEQYRPGASTETFSVPAYCVPKEEVRITCADPSPDIREKYIGSDGTVRFYVHPAIDGETWVPKMEELVQCKKSIPTPVIPTSSTRTVFVLDPETTPHSLKLHCPLKISRFVRNVGPQTIQHCVTVSHDLEQVSCTHFALLRETIGISYQGKQEEPGWGFLVREMKPFPHVEGKKMLIPCFALYGKDLNHPEKEPLLVQMIKQSKEKPMDYALNHVFYPIISCFTSAFRQRGILLEAHGQNSLLEVDENMNPTGRIVHRDLDEEVDPEMRRRLNLPLEGFHPMQLVPKVSEEDPKGSTHSIIYDKSIGRLHLNYIAQLLKDHFHVPPVKVQRKCQAYFKKQFPDFGKYFPNTVYKYSDKEKEGLPNYFPAVDTKEQPIWRPISRELRARPTKAIC